MSRPLRIELSGGLYHVTSRGDRREAIYLDDDDRLNWLNLLGEVCEHFNWRVHAYCQMTNHYHLVVETPEANLSKGMRQLNGVYTQQINRRHKRVGHVFQGRYKAILVEKDAYLLELARYVVLNPVRAGMTNDIGEWSWSSYQATIGEVARPPWLHVRWLLAQFAPSHEAAIPLYKDFVHQGVGLPGIWSELSNQIYLGGERFIERMHKALGETQEDKEIPRAQRRPRTKSLTAFEDEAEDRNQAIQSAYRSGQYTLKAIGEHFGLHYATVSRIVKQTRAGR